MGRVGRRAGGAGLTRLRWPIAVPGGRDGREPPLKGRCDQEARLGSERRNYPGRRLGYAGEGRGKGWGAQKNK